MQSPGLVLCPNTAKTALTFHNLLDGGCVRVWSTREVCFNKRSGNPEARYLRAEDFGAVAFRLELR